MSKENLYLRPEIIALSVAILLLSAVGVFGGLPDYATSPVDTAHVEEEGGSGEPTETPVPHRVYLPLVLRNYAKELDSFLGGIEGIGEHGAMACVEYQGDPEDLEGLTLTANISQGDSVLDENVPAESIEGRTCFEMLDIDYTVDGLVSLELNATGEDRVLSNNTQVIDLGDYQHQRFILPVFAQSDFTEGPLEIAEIHMDLIYEDHWYAKDFTEGPLPPDPVDREDFPGEGNRNFMPHTLQAIYINGGGPSQEHPGYNSNYNVFYRNPYTGHVFKMGHIIPHEMLLNFLGIELSDIQPDNPFFLDDPLNAPILEYDPNFVLSTWGPPEWQYMPPHLEWEGQVPVPDHPDYSSGAMYNDGDLKFCNCLPQEYGPCLPTCANISLERFILNGYIDPDK